MNHSFIYTCVTKTKDGKEHKCTFQPHKEQNWWLVTVDTLGVDLTQYFEEDDFNDISAEYVRKYNLGDIISRDRKFVFED